MSRRSAFPWWALIGSLALLLGAAGLSLLFPRPAKLPVERSLPVSATPARAPVASFTPAAPREPSAATPTPEATLGDSLAAELNAPGGEPAHDVEVLHTLILRYFRRLHQRAGPPIGDDIDLARILTGRNPLHLLFLRPDHPALSPDGHLRDRWGTPYFIHPLGRNVFEVRSAGPDRKLFTEDDVLWTPSSPEE